MNVAFIGLGRMGKPMAANLLKAGHQLFVHNRSRAAVNELAAAGAIACASPAEASSQAEAVILCLPDPPAVHAVVSGSGGVLKGARPGTILCDMSTVDPETSRTAAKAGAALSVRFVDAPVSGGVTGAESGTLTIFIGGEGADVEPLMPLFLAMGKNINHMGPVGAGSVAKLANQMCVGAATVVIAEAFLMARQAGIDPQALFEALRTGFAGSRILERHLPNFILPRNFEPGFALALLAKDINLSAGVGQATGIPMAVTEAVSRYLEEAKAAGLGGVDMAGAVQLLEQKTGIKVEP